MVLTDDVAAEAEPFQGHDASGENDQPGFNWRLSFITITCWVSDSARPRTTPSIRLKRLGQCWGTHGAATCPPTICSAPNSVGCELWRSIRTTSFPGQRRLRLSQQTRRQQLWRMASPARDLSRLVIVIAIRSSFHRRPYGWEIWNKDSGKSLLSSYSRFGTYREALLRPRPFCQRDGAK